MLHLAGPVRADTHAQVLYSERREQLVVRREGGKTCMKRTLYNTPPNRLQHARQVKSATVN